MCLRRVRSFRSSRATEAAVEDNASVAAEQVNSGSDRAQNGPLATQSEPDCTPDPQAEAIVDRLQSSSEGAPLPDAAIKPIPTMPGYLRSHQSRPACGPSRLFRTQRLRPRPLIQHEESQGQDAQVESCANTSSTPYYKAIVEQGLDVPWFKELNWSGRGQNVEYEEWETVPLHRAFDPALGRTMKASVEKVWCRGVPLARKSLQWDRSVTYASLLGEARHLHHLRHPHIVRLVGTYQQGRQLSILTYPVANWNLDQFMSSCDPARESSGGLTIVSMTYALRQFFGCMAHVMKYLHNEQVVHMDIKPLNFLVFDGRTYSIREESFDVYLCDFGLSRKFHTMDSQSADYIGMTARYAAPEVANYMPHGRKSDIFSLGCVFLEMATILAITRENGSDLNLPEFLLQRRKSREANDDTFHGNPLAVAAWIAKLAPDLNRAWPGHAEPLLDLITQMLAAEPADRPTAHELSERLPPNDCCRRPRARIQLSRN